MLLFSTSTRIASAINCCVFPTLHALALDDLGDACVRRAKAGGGAKPQKQGATKGGKRGARARGPELDINQPKFFGGDAADVDDDIDEEEPDSPAEVSEW